jgi:hypothetical protein
MTTPYIRTHDGWIRQMVSEGFCVQFREEEESERGQQFRQWIEDGNTPDYFPSVEEAMAMIDEES